jgi:uncharacterized membrane protein
METVVAVSFASPAPAYEALTKLKELDGQGQLRMREGGVVAREANGQLVVKDRIGDDDDVGLATASGGLIGLLIGVLAGPVGILLGGSLGLLTGSMFDLTSVDEEDEEDSVLGSFARHIGAGRTAVLALLDEQSDEVVDTAMQSLGGDVLRRPADDVAAELSAAADARDKAEKEARKKLRAERRESRKEDVDAKLDALRARFHKSAKDEKAPTAQA